jgi:hypothetical protein
MAGTVNVCNGQVTKGPCDLTLTNERLITCMYSNFIMFKFYYIQSEFHRDSKNNSVFVHEDFEKWRICLSEKTNLKL